MSARLKPILALVSAAILSGFTGTTVQAQSVLISQGTSTLADVFLQVSPPAEAVTVSWFVVENLANSIYTYGYNVNNPLGDQQLDFGGGPTGIPETLSTFTLSFNTTVPGAYVSGTAPINGTLTVGNGTLAWSFPDVNPNGTSPLLAFQSKLPPTPGNASVGGGATPPAPWSTISPGQPVAVPRTIPEPGTTSLFALTAIVLLPFSSTWRRLVRDSWNSRRYF